MLTPLRKLAEPRWLITFRLACTVSSFPLRTAELLISTSTACNLDSTYAATYQCGVTLSLPSDAEPLSWSTTNDLGVQPDTSSGSLSGSGGVFYSMLSKTGRRITMGNRNGQSCSYTLRSPRLYLRIHTILC